MKEYHIEWRQEGYVCLDPNNRIISEPFLTWDEANNWLEYYIQNIESKDKDRFSFYCENELDFGE